MKVTVIGGGSYQWSLGFCSQFINGHLLSDVQVCLMDTDPLPLDIVFQAAQIMNRSSGSPIGLTKTTELARALAGADFVLVSISTGDLAAMEHDLKIPEKYGIWQGFRAVLQSILAIHGFVSFEIKFMQDFSGYHSDNFGIVDNQASLHIILPSNFVAGRDSGKI